MENEWRIKKRRSVCDFTCSGPVLSSLHAWAGPLSAHARIRGGAVHVLPRCRSDRRKLRILCACAVFKGRGWIAAKIKMEEVDGIIISTLKEVGW